MFSGNIMCFGTCTMVIPCFLDMLPCKTMFSGTRMFFGHQVPWSTTVLIPSVYHCTNIVGICKDKLQCVVVF